MGKKVFAAQHLIKAHDPACGKGGKKRRRTFSAAGNAEEHHGEGKAAGGMPAGEAAAARSPGPEGKKMPVGKGSPEFDEFPGAVYAGKRLERGHQQRVAAQERAMSRPARIHALLPEAYPHRKSAAQPSPMQATARFMPS